MIRTLTCLLFILTVLASIAAPKGRWLATTYNYGAFDEDMGTAYCKFYVVNDGDQPMAIVNARANCGCTRPSYTTAPIAPGDTGVVTVGYDPKGRPGRFVKRISVDLDSEPLRTNLQISGTVIGASNTLKSRYPIDLGPIKLRETVLAYGEVTKGHTVGKYIEGYNASADTVWPVCQNAPDYIAPLPQPTAVGPGEQFIISTVFYSNRCPDWGIVTGSFTIKPSASSALSQTIETVAIIQEDFSVLTPEQLRKAPVMTLSDPSIDLGQIIGTEKIIKTFEIVNSGKSPLQIRSITTPDKALAIIAKEQRVKPGKSMKVTVEVDPSKLAASTLLNARITIIANDPLHPTQIVRVVGSR